MPLPQNTFRVAMESHGYLFFSTIAYLLPLLFFSCKSPARNALGQPLADSSMEKGRILAATYCSSCHLLPDPLLLDKKTWENGAMPGMGPRLGIFSYKGKNYPSNLFDLDVSKDFYPSRPLIPTWQWQQLIDYYSGSSPDSLPGQNRKEAIHSGLSIFEAVIPFDPVVPAGHHEEPVTGFVHFDTTEGKRSLVAAPLFPGAIYRYNDSLRLIDSLSLFGGVVDISFQPDRMVACTIGNINPNNSRLGRAFGIPYDTTGRMKQDPSLLFSQLARPVQITAVDLNGDGRKDYLVCEFGNLTGALSWEESSGKGTYVRHILKAAPGAIKAWVNDYNHDGLPDIWALFAQGEEGIFLFTNKGKGVFEQQQVLRFPPVYGSSYFELADFNKDGFPDIIYTCGDNADFSRILKPYHGVYIFINDGHNHFTQRWFFPINGCYKAMARDFDGDGDLDIAAISFFADYIRQPEEGFVYLENLGDFQFRAYSLPEGKTGRWLTMDAGDLDGDGKEDIVLGNFSKAPGMMRSRTDWKKGPPFLFLHNIHK